MKLVVLFVLFSQTCLASLPKSNDGIEGMAKVKHELSNYLFQGRDLPHLLKLDDKEYAIDYNINSTLEEYAKKILKRYRPDFGSIVVIDNDTGNVLTAVDYHKKEKRFKRTLSFSPAHPAASIFKVITAADLIENSGVDNDSSFYFRGRSTTLYKYQLKDKESRWRRKISFEKAFALSNNVIFGKAAIKNNASETILHTAKKFKFNDEIFEEINIGVSNFLVPKTDYNLAELASGFNRATLMSPVHGAMIASVVANNGKLIKPSFISKVVDNKSKNIIWFPAREHEQVLKQETAQTLQGMMELTVQRGTASSMFRRMKSSVAKKVKIGGKTGTIRGGIPYGQRDWFICYASPQNEALGKGISVAVMVINLEKWYVKSTFLAKSLIKYYYQNSFPLRNFYNLGMK